VLIIDSNNARIVENDAKDNPVWQYFPTPVRVAIQRLYRREQSDWQMVTQ